MASRLARYQDAATTQREAREHCSRCNNRQHNSSSSSLPRQHKRMSGSTTGRVRVGIDDYLWRHDAAAAVTVGRPRACRTYRSLLLLLLVQMTS